MLVPAPEILEVVDTYMNMGMDMDKTAKALNMERQALASIVQSSAAQSYITGLFYSSGLRNREKFFDMMENIIDKKIEEMEESEMGSSKDIIEILSTFHKMKMDEMKLELKRQELAIKAEELRKGKPSVAVQINNGSDVSPESTAAWANVIGKIVSRSKK